MEQARYSEKEKVEEVKKKQVQIYTAALRGPLSISC